MFTLAHLSDLHLPLPAAPRWRDLAGKRILGYLSYHLKRKTVHDRSVLAALVDDLLQHAPDHIAITGDLTNIGLPEEFASTARWLRALRAADALTVIPGNHDAYVAVPWQQSLERWSAFMSDGDAPIQGERGFPFLRRRGEVALVGVSTRLPDAVEPGHRPGRQRAAGAAGPAPRAARRAVAVSRGADPPSPHRRHDQPPQASDRPGGLSRRD